MNKILKTMIRRSKAWNKKLKDYDKKYTKLKTKSVKLDRQSMHRDI